MGADFDAGVPFKGYTSGLTDTMFVDSLSDADLTRLNELLPWGAFTVDRHGRRFGNAAGKGKRDTPQAVPDRRVLLLDRQFGLADKHVLEVGCFEGIHTTGLAMFAKQVTAVDARIENVVKTIVRTALFGYSPRVFKCDVERSPLDLERLRADVMFHVGVLYHLEDPVSHLRALSKYISLGLLLDTHFALEEQAGLSYEVAGRQWRYYRYPEGRPEDMFAGTSDHAKWLTLPSILDLLGEAGFSDVPIVEKREERNGPRVLLIARRR
jgi:tRNA (mo5U34)-methyltransferase